MGRVAQWVKNRTEGKEWRLDAKAGQMRMRMRIIRISKGYEK